MRVRILFLGVKFVYIIGFTVYIYIYFFPPSAFLPTVSPAWHGFFSHTLWGNGNQAIKLIIDEGVHMEDRTGVRALGDLGGIGGTKKSIQVAWSYDSCGDMSWAAHLPIFQW